MNIELFDLKEIDRIKILINICYLKYALRCYKTKLFK